MSFAPAPSRRPGVLRLALGAVLAVLTVGLLCAPATAAAAGGATLGGSVTADSGSAGSVSARHAAGAADSGRGSAGSVRPVADALHAAPGDGVGCGQRDQGDQGSQPGAPARGSAYEQLLTTLAYAHAVPGTGPSDSVALDATPDRGPPPRDPPTHVELSVLRV